MSPAPNSSETPAVAELLARERRLSTGSVSAVIELLKGGATIPFIARYRKESTGGLDEVALREIAERSRYLSELAERRIAVKGAIAERGKLTPELARAIDECKTKTELEELYAPYKSKRRTRGEVARELGLEPLAELIWSRRGSGDVQAVAQSFVQKNPKIAGPEAAIDGAVDICSEKAAEDPRARRSVLEALRRGVLRAKKSSKHKAQKTKFDDYADYGEPISRVASHRYLAICRGERDGVLKVSFELDEDSVLNELERIFGVRGRDAWTELLRRAISEAFSRLMLSSARASVRSELGERAERDAIGIFAKNLEKLLLGPPFGANWVLGIDPGQRTGCKWAVVDATLALIDNGVFNLVQGAEAERAAEQTLTKILQRHPIAAVAVGNGTHGRETEDFVRSMLKKAGKDRILCVLVSEAGASVYSASEVARQELPDHDVTVRGAVSIARRLIDPLSELVKVDPKSIGVGQYQHDVGENLLGEKLGEVVESCVNKVGVELNTASPSLLSYVSGIGAKLAQRIVLHREQHGKFESRRKLLEVSGLGAKTYEQAAGFLRIRGGKEPLDASAVHPERYALVAQMARETGVAVRDLIGNPSALKRVDRSKYLSSDVGAYTLDDIFAELEKPGRDPRAAFEAPAFRDDVRSIEQVKPGMVLEGRVTNVTAFGAFVDIGVHQDGLVHVSALADRFVKDPNEVVGVGDLIKVRVLSVDLERKRISLSAK
jgi:protein Tex